MPESVIQQKHRNKNKFKNCKKKNNIEKYIKYIVDDERKRLK